MLRNTVRSEFCALVLRTTAAQYPGQACWGKDNSFSLKLAAEKASHQDLGMCICTGGHLIPLHKGKGWVPRKFSEAIISEGMAATTHVPVHSHTALSASNLI